jgi:hypothetical protein
MNAAEHKEMWFKSSRAIDANASRIRIQSLTERIDELEGQAVTRSREKELAKLRRKLEKIHAALERGATRI